MGHVLVLKLVKPTKIASRAPQELAVDQRLIL
jgi:hypothetical protein